MKSAQLGKALTSGKVLIRSGRKVVGQVYLKFRHPGVKDRIVSPYPLRDINSDTSYINLSATYSAEQLQNSNLEDLVLTEQLELKMV